MNRYNTFERGSLFTRPGKDGYLYQLVRVAEGVQGHTANGTPTSPKYLWNLINLTNDGKARVSDTTRMLETDGNYVTLSQLVNNFGIDLVPAGHISDHKAGLARVARENAQPDIAQILSAIVDALRAPRCMGYSF